MECSGYSKMPGTISSSCWSGFDPMILILYQKASATTLAKNSLSNEFKWWKHICDRQLTTDNRFWEILHNINVIANHLNQLVNAELLVFGTLIVVMAVFWSKLFRYPNNSLRKNRSQFWKILSYWPPNIKMKSIAIVTNWKLTMFVLKPIQVLLG